MISRIIKVEVGVISRGGRLRLITLTETLIILDITETEQQPTLFFKTDLYYAIVCNKKKVLFSETYSFELKVKTRRFHRNLLFDFICVA